MSILRNHRRLIVGIVLGLIAWWVAARLGLSASSRPLVGWNLGALVFLVSTWWLYVTTPECDMRDLARYDEGPGVIIVLALAAIGAGIAAILGALTPAQHESPAARKLALTLAGLTLFTSWFVLQTLFTGHYARRHFQDIEARGEAGGFQFPGDPPSSFLDFAYLALCVGATAQVSDPGVKTTKLRNLVTAHAVTSFFFNTAVIALGINILSGLLGH